MNDWSERLADLLAGRGQGADDELEAGAQIRVEGADIAPIPLARHYRLEAGNRQLLWIRPITGHYRAPDGSDRFDLNIARRRAVSFTAARLSEDGAVAFDLEDGGSVRIEAAGPEAMAEIARWDAFMLGALTSEQERVLDALDAD